MANLLDEDAIRRGISGSRWTLGDGALLLEAAFDDFDGAWAFATGVADIARAANHHPDILVHGWNKVRIVLSTHSEGGVTDLDVEMAASIDALFD